MKQKELLIEFAKWLDENFMFYDKLKNYDCVDAFLQSINYSNESNEFRTVGNNEQAKKSFCHSLAPCCEYSKNQVCTYNKFCQYK